MGYDIHTHAITDECRPQCLTRQNGRLLQYRSLATIGRREGFQIVKAIDGQPRLNGACLIFAQRMTYFRGGSHTRQAYYESIADPAEVGCQLLATEARRWSGYPLYSLDNHLMIMEWFESSYKAPGGRIPVPASGDKSIGLHCVTVETYDADTETFTFWNSWGPGWGNNAHGTMSLNYLRRYHYETFVLRHARWGPSPAKAGSMAEAQRDPKELRRLWIAENPRSMWIWRSPRRNIEGVRYETISPTTGRPIVCFELKTGFGLRIGWMFLRHSLAKKTFSEITELFVWPIYRRLGLGTSLEEMALSEAQDYGSTEIRLIMNEADAVIGPPRAAARKFAKARGYELRWRDTVQPRAPATGIKAVR